MTEATNTEAHEHLPLSRLDIGSIDRRASGWWGMLTLILTEAFLFAYLLFSYYYVAIEHGRSWLPAELPSFRLSGPSTIILIASSIAVWFGERGARRGSKGKLVSGLFAGVVLGLVFAGIQVREWMDKPFNLSSDSYGSLYFTITGFHLAHVVGGVLILAALTLWSALGYFDRERLTAISVGAIYWHFVDIVWLAIFFTFYVTPRLG